MIDAESEDDIPQLSAQSLAALQEFYADQAKLLEQRSPTETGDLLNMPDEDWQLSQFWYSEETAKKLAIESMAIAGETGRIACVSCPSLYHQLKEMKSASCKVTILEYDQRFQTFGSDFVFYDYKEPLALPKDLEGAFDLVVADPPFLSEECLAKTALTMNYLAKDKIILCTGATMEELAGRLLQVKVCGYLPSHTRNLANEFRCYANYTTTHLDGPR